MDLQCLIQHVCPMLQGPTYNYKTSKCIVLQKSTGYFITLDQSTDISRINFMLVVLS